MVLANLGRIAPRDRGVLFWKLGQRHCEERKRRSNPFFVCAALWIASRSLSSGAHSRDPLARNDGCVAATFPAVIVREADDPVFQSSCDEIERPRRTGSSGQAGRRQLREKRRSDRG